MRNWPKDFWDGFTKFIASPNKTISEWMQKRDSEKGEVSRGFAAWILTLGKCVPSAGLAVFSLDKTLRAIFSFLSKEASQSFSLIEAVANFIVCLFTRGKSIRGLFGIGLDKLPAFTSDLADEGYDSVKDLLDRIERKTVDFFLNLAPIIADFAPRKNVAIQGEEVVDESIQSDVAKAKVIAAFRKIFKLSEFDVEYGVKAPQIQKELKQQIEQEKRDNIAAAREVLAASLPTEMSPLSPATNDDSNLSSSQSYGSFSSSASGSNYSTLTHAEASSINATYTVEHEESGEDIASDIFDEEEIQPQSTPLISRHDQGAGPGLTVDTCLAETPAEAIQPLEVFVEEAPTKVEMSAEEAISILQKFSKQLGDIELSEFDKQYYQTCKVSNKAPKRTALPDMRKVLDKKVKKTIHNNEVDKVHNWPVVKALRVAFITAGVVASLVAGATAYLGAEKLIQMVYDVLTDYSGAFSCLDWITNLYVTAPAGVIASISSFLAFATFQVEKIPRNFSELFYAVFTKKGWKEHGPHKILFALIIGAWVTTTIGFRTRFELGNSFDDIADRFPFMSFLNHAAILYTGVACNVAATFAAQVTKFMTTGLKDYLRIFADLPKKRGNRIKLFAMAGIGMWDSVAYSLGCYISTFDAFKQILHVSDAKGWKIFSGISGFTSAFTTSLAFTWYQGLMQEYKKRIREQEGRKISKHNEAAGGTPKPPSPPKSEPGTPGQRTKPFSWFYDKGSDRSPPSSDKSSPNTPRGNAAGAMEAAAVVSDEEALAAEWLARFAPEEQRATTAETNKLSAQFTEFLTAIEDDRPLIADDGPDVDESFTVSKTPQTQEEKIIAMAAKFIAEQDLDPDADGADVLAALQQFMQQQKEVNAADVGADSNFDAPAQEVEVEEYLPEMEQQLAEAQSFADEMLATYGAESDEYTIAEKICQGMAQSYDQVEKDLDADCVDAEGDDDFEVGAMASEVASEDEQTVTSSWQLMQNQMQFTGESIALDDEDNEEFFDCEEIPAEKLATLPVLANVELMNEDLVNVANVALA